MKLERKIAKRHFCPLWRLIDRDSAQSFVFGWRKLVANKLVETFDWLSCRKKYVLSGFMNAQGQKSEQKHETKKLVEFHNQLHKLTMR